MVSLLLSVAQVRANAAGETPAPTETAQAVLDESAGDSACTKPPRWDQTTRLYYKDRVSKQWSFQVDQPEMDVSLEFFYYQDYDRKGCPFDCSIGACQLDEVGDGDSPLGSFHISDGKEGSDSGKVLQSGRLKQGSYTAEFHVTGQGSINIGLRVKKRAVPTATFPPPATSTPETPIAASETPTPEEPGPVTPTPTATETLPGETATSTPTPTETPAGTATATVTETASPTPTVTGTSPGIRLTLTPTATPTPTEIQPSATSTPTVTPTSIGTGITVTPTETRVVRPPSTRPRNTAPAPTATSIARVPGATPERTAVSTQAQPAVTAAVATLPPPAMGLAGAPQAIIPQTGFDWGAYRQEVDLSRSLFLKLGLGLIGVGLAFFWAGRRNDL